jgi:hypothetical protein
MQRLRPFFASFDALLGVSGTLLSSAGPALPRLAGAVPAAWADNSAWDRQVRLTYSKDATDPLFGSSSLRVDVAAGFAQFVQAVSVVPGNAYRLSVWVRGQPATGSPTQMTAILALMGIKDYTIYGSSAIDIGPQWALLELRLAYVLGRPTDARIPCFFLLKVSQQGSFWLDGAHMAPVGAALPPITLAPPASTPIPRSYFCMHNHLNHEPGVAFDWPVLDFGMYRTWDSGVMWGTIQKAGRGQYDWAWLDQDVANAQKRGIKVGAEYVRGRGAQDDSGTCPEKARSF